MVKPSRIVFKDHNPHGLSPHFARADPLRTTGNRGAFWWQHFETYHHKVSLRITSQADSQPGLGRTSEANSQPIRRIGPESGASEGVICV